MWWWIGVPSVLVAGVVAGGLWARLRHIRAETERRRLEEEDARFEVEALERQRLERDKAEAARMLALEDATLFGEPGEAVRDAAERLGGIVRTETDDMYYCRFGNHAYTVEKAAIRPATHGGRVAFRIVDPLASWPPGELGLGVGAINRHGWRVVSEFAREKLDRERLFDGDDIAYVTLFVDPHGRVMEQTGHTNARWHRVTDPGTGEPVLAWEEMLGDRGKPV